MRPVPEIPNGEGYCAFSAAKVMNIVVGTLLLCENCANGLFTDEVWKKAAQTTTEVDMSADISGILQAQRQASNFSIAMLAKRRGLNAAQARQEAREIAKLWWTDKQAAEQQLLAQATAKPGGQLSAEKKTSDLDSGKQKEQTSSNSWIPYACAGVCLVLSWNIWRLCRWCYRCGDWLWYWHVD